MSLSRRQLDELRPLVDKAVHRFFGFSEETLVAAAINCIDRGYDSRKTEDKLRSILDDTQAMQFTDKLFDVYEEFKSMSRHGKSRKRHEKEEEEEIIKPKKSRRFDDGPPVNVSIPEPGQPSPGQLTADKIKDMMANAQKLIRERKAELNIRGQPPMPPQMQITQPVPNQEILMADATAKAKKAAELQARIQAQLSTTGLGLGFGFGMPPPAALGGPPGGLTTTAKSTFMPTPVILDEEGRTIDAQTGETIQLQHHMPTLKANIRAKRREQFKAVQEKPPEEIHESKFFDSRVSGRQGQRGRKAFTFNEPGKFEQLASRMRTKAQLDKLQNEIAHAAKKTGIASAAKLATIQPKKELLRDDVPELEWWDSIILKGDAYSEDNDEVKAKDTIEGVTHLVEHPTQMKPPAEPTKEIQIPVMLTKKERKKLRRQNRNETQKELQEKIRLGLMPPPEPKVRMANLMRVLGTEAVQDPTKVEAHVRAQMAKRVRQHEEANASRKLTKDQRREKKANKLKEDTSLGVQVSVYRVRDLTNQSQKFKVETNAKQLFMTGMVVLHKDCNVVVVEGGPKQNKKFRRLMLHRIKWGEERKVTVKDDDSDSEEEDKHRSNTCVLVWDGMVQTRAFSEVRFKMCPTESFAREQFRKMGVEHYWDLAYSGSVLEAAGED